MELLDIALIAQYVVIISLAIAIVCSLYMIYTCHKADKALKELADRLNSRRDKPLS